MVKPPASVKVSDLFRVSLWGQVADKPWSGHEHLLMACFRFNHEGSREVAIVNLHPAIEFVQKALEKGDAKKPLEFENYVEQHTKVLEQSFNPLPWCEEIPDFIIYRQVVKKGWLLFTPSCHVLSERPLGGELQTGWSTRIIEHQDALAQMQPILDKLPADDNICQAWSIAKQCISPPQVAVSAADKKEPKVDAGPSSSAKDAMKSIIALSLDQQYPYPGLASSWI